MTIPIKFVADRLTAQDDPKLWEVVLAVLSEEFLDRYRKGDGGKEVRHLQVGVCSHWLRPHQTRWTKAGGFAAPIGYMGARWFGCGLPEFDWSVILAFDGEHWKRVDKFSGKKQRVLRVAVPTRSARHKQAAIHATWSTSHGHTAYGFRNIDGAWACVAASDEDKNGHILREKINLAQ